MKKIMEKTASLYHRYEYYKVNHHNNVVQYSTNYPYCSEKFKLMYPHHTYLNRESELLVLDVRDIEAYIKSLLPCIFPLEPTDIINHILSLPSSGIFEIYHGEEPPTSFDEWIDTRIDECFLNITLYSPPELCSELEKIVINNHDDIYIVFDNVLSLVAMLLIEANVPQTHNYTLYGWFDDTSVVLINDKENIE